MAIRVTELNRFWCEVAGTQSVSRMLHPEDWYTYSAFIVDV